MFQIDTAKKAKKSARALEKALAHLGLTLKLGQALDVLAKMAGFADWNAMSASLQGEASQPLDNFSIFQVNIVEVRSVTINEQPFDLQYVNTEMLGWLSDWSNPDNPYGPDLDQTIIELNYVEDGLVYESSITTEQLLSMKWNSQKEGFASNNGDLYKFYFAVPFGKSVAGLCKEENKLAVPAGYHVYKTLMGTWRWTRGELGSLGAVDGKNLDSYQDALEDAIRDAKEQEALKQNPPAALEEFRKLNQQVEAQGLNDDPLFKLSDEIKQEYLNSGCQSSDVDIAINRLLNECGELFADGDAAWEFLMEEPHENREDD